MSDNHQPPEIKSVRIVKMPPAHWASFVALGLSILTAIVLIWQGYETRTYYRLTLSPIVTPYVTDSYHEEMVGIFLKNQGPGPGVVTIIGVFLDGNPTRPYDIIQKIAKDGLFNSQSDQVPVHRKCGEEFSMAEDRTVRLLAFPIDLVRSNDLDERRNFQNFIHERIDFKYKWCSVYDKCYSCSTATTCGPPREVARTTTANCVEPA